MKQVVLASLVFIFGCSKEERSVPEIKIASVTVIASSDHFEYENVKFWFGLSFYNDKDQVKIMFREESVADCLMGSVEQREAIRKALANLEGIENVKMVLRNEYVLTMQPENWDKMKKSIFHAMLHP